ncbi:MAG: hydantoinase B/oxoprolinase family protein, partial [Alphaproteobacteria bacterium]|nr:hydantoinase B/oxoprolinase family protein [Alphaproteobacteria bacterium]
ETLDMFDELLDRSERLTRSRLSALPPGRYEFEDYLDNDGVDLDRLIPIKVAVTIGNGEVIVDFTGASPQVRGPVDAPPSVSLAAAFFVVRCITDAAISSNSGCLRPIKVVTPPGSVVNPQFPAPVNARSIMFCLIVDAIFGAFAKAAPGKVPACGYDFPLVHFGGLDRHKKPFVFPRSAPAVMARARTVTASTSIAPRTATRSRCRPKPPRWTSRSGSPRSASARIPAAPDVSAAGSATPRSTRRWPTA